jgi:PhnB protein
MSTSVTTHLNFQGNARQALAFYQSVFGGSLTVTTYADANASQAASDPNHVMWGQVTSETGFRIMAYDVQADRAWHPGENALYVVVEDTSSSDVTAYWDALSEGAEILQPLAPAQWAPLYGMLKDRFDIVWVMSVSQGAAAS